MHLLRVESRSIDDTSEAVDLGQSPADIVALSFTDTDLALLAAAWEVRKNASPSLRLANLAALRHPYSVDLYVEKVLSKARFVLVRLLGGMDYWRYGVDELASLARSSGFQLAMVPGDHRADARLDEASTLDPQALRQIWSYFTAGGIENIAQCLRFMASHVSPLQVGEQLTAARRAQSSNPVMAARQAWSPNPVMGGEAAPAVTSQAFGFFPPAMRLSATQAPEALIVFYRAWMLAADTDPVVALAQALGSRGFRVTAVYVTSLKDAAAAVPLRAYLKANRPDIILNLTAFSARLDTGGAVLDQANAPVFQLALSGGGRAQWMASQRGLGPADLAMNIVLPELDGRIFAGAISFKGETPRNEALEFTRLVHQPEANGVSHAADLALAWATLARTPRAERRLACILSDYPAKAGRTGYAVGLDTPRSIITIAERLAHEGFTVEPPGNAAALAAALSAGETSAVLSIADYECLLATLPTRFVDQVRAAWGEPGGDAAVQDGAFRFRIVRAGNLLIGVQPDRGNTAARKTEYHDALLPPRHAYVAFYLWLRGVEQVHAVIHCGTHGTLEWLPGKATALSETCAPQAVLGAVPLIYPFIVNNPGEAAQAKRRVAAVTIGHLTPPLTQAGAHGAAAEVENLFDEYAEAQSLDPRRAARLAELIMARAWETGLAAESGVAADEDPQAALIKLNAWLCDIKDMQIGDGLHVFGQAPDAGRCAETARSLSAMTGSQDAAAVECLIRSCAEAELRGLLAALDGRFVPPGPAGAPTRGRIDVLPTGRNLYGIDPRAVPTRTAWEIGRRTAEALLIRHAQDHGDWPKRIVLDIWGSATMRTGGDDLAQAFALLGVRPRWDSGSSRVAGFDILPLAVLNRPRVDVTLRISGLFRDVFPSQIALFDDVVREVAALEEAPEDNPLAASVLSGAGDSGRRIFGAAPGAYGIGLSRMLADENWLDRDALGEAYLQATSHAYGVGLEGVPAARDFRARVARADAFVHVQDMPGQDVLDADAFAEHEGGFAAAAAVLGNDPALYHADTTDPDRSRIRTVRQEVARVLRARATNPRWLAGQMRHGFRGAAEIAQTVDNFLAYAALADVTDDRQFDLLFDATIGDETVRTFLTDANPAAARGIAERFDEATRRGLWRTRRNSAAMVVTTMRTEAR
ncbi:cobaltochelatase subunit CobN [Rhodopila sp.]|uniref:cobaltochelatase subunit CobN n=1 Tax=Rhodopila sp. TaxID=2480087 RepID=UPI003D0B1E8F